MTTIKTEMKLKTNRERVRERTTVINMLSLS